MTMQNNLSTVALFGAYGVIYALAGFATKHPDAKPSARMFAKTVALGLVAGLVASTQADAPTHGAIDAGLAIAVPVVDNLFNQLLPPAAGGSSIHGTGAPNR